MTTLPAADARSQLSGTALLAAHRDGEAATASGDYLDADQVTHAVRRAGRGPR